MLAEMAGDVAASQSSAEGRLVADVPPVVVLELARGVARK
jgi:hypothetical protein